MTLAPWVCTRYQDNIASKLFHRDVGLRQLYAPTSMEHVWGEGDGHLGREGYPFR